MTNKQRGVSPALQRISQSTSPIVQELSWIKDNSPSVKAARQAGKAMLSYEIAERYAEKAYNFHDLKEQQSEEQQVSGKQRLRTQRFQETS